MGANLCTLRQPVSTRSSKNGTAGILEKRADPAAAASLWEFFKPACLESTGKDDDQKKKKKKKKEEEEEEEEEELVGQETETTTEINVKLASICGGESRRTLGEWLLASPLPKARRDSASCRPSHVDYKLHYSSSKRRVSPWISHPACNFDIMDKHAPLVSPDDRLPRPPSSGVVLATDTSKRDHDQVHQKRERSIRPVLSFSPSPSCWDNSSIHGDHDQGDELSNLWGARDSICIERERRIGEGSSTAVINQSVACLVKSRSGKMKKKVSFRLPEEADIFVFYSPPAHYDHDASRDGLHE